MASLQQVQDAQAAEAEVSTAQTQAITDLSARVAAIPQGAATATDLDGLLSTAQSNAGLTASNTAAIQAIAPAA